MSAGQKRFAVFEHPSRGFRAVPLGFSWFAALLPWLWLFVNGLLVLGVMVWVVGAVLVLLTSGLSAAGEPGVAFGIRAIFVVILGFVLGRRAADLAANSLERRGYFFRGVAAAVSGGSACNLVKAGAGEVVRDRALLRTKGASFVPKSWRPVLAVTGLTWRAAIRFRLFWVMIGLLLVCVTFLPLLVKDDGTARGFVQIMLTYTLGLITMLLGFCTLWTASGTLAKDIEDCQMQMVVTKPVARWQVWVGKWLGLVSLNAVLLAVAGLSVYLLLMYRTAKLPEELRQTLREEIFVARASLKEPPVDISRAVEIMTTDRLQRAELNTLLDANLVRQQVIEELKAEQQVVPQGYMRRWEIDVSSLGRARDEQMQIRIKFHAAQTNESGLYLGIWQVGPPDTDRVAVLTGTYSDNTFHEIPIPKDRVDEKGILTVTFINQNQTSLLFPLDDGFEVLHRDGGFGLNFARGLMIIFCWLALFAAVGLAAGSFLSFPVAALVAVSVFFVGMSSGTLQGVVEDGTFLGTDHETGQPLNRTLDGIMVPLFRVLFTVVSFAQNFSPVDSLSTGRSITWGTVGLAFVQVVGLTGGLFAVFGIHMFHRRELAATQATT